MIYFNKSVVNEFCKPNYLQFCGSNHYNLSYYYSLTMRPFNTPFLSSAEYEIIHQPMVWSIIPYFRKMHGSILEDTSKLISTSHKCYDMPASVHIIFIRLQYLPKIITFMIRTFPSSRSIQMSISMPISA